MFDRLHVFSGGAAGAWRVTGMRAWRGEPLPPASHIDIGTGMAPPAALWSLRGVVSNERYVTRGEKQALAAWLTRSGHTQGPIFRRVWGAARVGAGLSPAAVAAIVQRRAALAGLAGDFGGHSLRSGFVTESARQGIALPAVMAMTEHRAVASVVSYYQAGEVSAHPIARLLEGNGADRP